MKFEFNKEMVVSTFHISRECFDTIENVISRNFDKCEDHFLLCLFLSIQDTDSGFRIKVPNKEFLDNNKTNFEEPFILLQLALDSKSKWLVIDVDGPIDEQYPVFKSE